MAKFKPLPPLEELRKAFDYDSETGFLHHRHAKPGVFKDQVAGCKNKQGYIQVNINYSTYRVHRIIWMLEHGYDPGNKGIDHRNGKRDDNRLRNLRLASQTENNWNTPRRRVEKMPSGNYRTRIMNNGRLVALGSYPTRAEAEAAYDSKAIELRGEFAFQECRQDSA